MIKRKQFLAIAAAIVLLVFISNIMAFFTSSDSTSNRFRAVTPPEPVVQIAVTEEFEPPSEKTNEPFRKDVKITNSGTQMCYVRVRLEISNYEFADFAYYSADGNSYVKAENYITDPEAQKHEFAAMGKDRFSRRQHRSSKFIRYFCVCRSGRCE